MAAKRCNYCSRVRQMEYKILLPSAAEFINDTYNRRMFRADRPRLYNYDILCSDCQIEINRHLQVYHDLKKTFYHTDSYYNIVDVPVYATQSTELNRNENQTIRLYLVYQQNQDPPKDAIYDYFSLQDSLEYVIQKFYSLKRLPVAPRDIQLVAFERRGQSFQVISCDHKKLLHELTIKNDDHLYFQPITRSSPTITVDVFGPKQGTNIRIECAKTEQINSLLIESIKRFGLDTVPQKCIQLHLEGNRITNEQLYQTFIDLKVKDNSIFHLDTDKTSQTVDTNRDSKTADADKLSPTVNDNKDSSTADADKLSLTVNDNKDSSTADAHKLRPTVNDNKDSSTAHVDKNNLITDVDTNELSTNTNRNDQSNVGDKNSRVTANDKRQISTASLIPTETVPLLPTEEEPSQVYVRGHFPGEEIIDLSVPLSATVRELTMKIVSKKGDHLWQFDLIFNGTTLENDDPDRRLSELGVKPNDRIRAYMESITPVSRPSTALTEQKPTVANQIRRRRRRYQPVGLRNLGNTCFMNSVLQCLSHVTPLRDFFLDSIRRAQTESYFVNPFDTCGAVTGAFSEVIWNLWEDGSYEFEPARLKRVVGERAPRFARFDQQDVQEFMIFLLDTLNKELLASNNLDQEASEIIKRLFHGEMKTNITCLECRRERKTMNTIGFLPLPLTQQERVFTVHFASIDGRDHDVTYVPVINSGLIKHVVVNFVELRPSISIDRITVESLEINDKLSFDTPLSIVLGNELLFVEQKEENYEWHKKPKPLYPTEFPKDIIHCFEEFVTLEMLNDPWLCHEKCNRSTKVAKQLQLQSLPPVLIVQLKRFAQNKEVRSKINTYVEFPLDGLDLKQFLPPDIPMDKTIYDLIAVIDHIGSIYGGHYTVCVRQQSESDQWYRISDSSVSRTSTSDIVSCNAYILFYLRRDQKAKT